MNIDHAALDNLKILFGGDFEKYFASFLANTKKYLNEIEIHVKENRLVDAHNVAHKLVSSTSQYGATELSAAAREFEYCAETDLDILSGMVSKMYVEFDHYKNYFRT